LPPVIASVAAASSKAKGIGMNRNKDTRNTQPISTPKDSGLEFRKRFS